MLLLVSIVLFGSSIQALYASGPKREMRATWLTTVGNIDWPKYSGPSAQKQELLQMLDSIRSLNLNVVFFHIRPCADAFYISAYEPWSSYLKVARGTYPGFDPLQFCIDECHKRGLACHAWMNPYRYSNRQGADWTGQDDHELNYTHTHPEWLLHYSSSIILDPGLPEVRQRIKDVVGDVLNKYDVDGIIFDDYFYPYGGTSTQDSATVRKYKPEGMNVHDWRRDNVNRMVQDVYDTIQAVKPWVTFGISPFGIWTTSYTVAAQEDVSLPPNITGGNMYQEIYCDPVAWLKQGTVDYLSPQLYWKIGGAQDYSILSKWWGRLCERFGKHFYSSMAIYKYSENSDAAYTISELENQTLLNREAVKDNAPGAVFYNTLAWVYDRKFRRAFTKREFRTNALPPAINWKPAAERTMVNNLQLSGRTLSWTHADADVHFAVYAVPDSLQGEPSPFCRGESLLGVSYSTQYVLPDDVSTATHRIAVSVLDGYNNEYSLRVLGEPEAQSVAAKLLIPYDGDPRRVPLTFTWQAVPQADSYIFQLARDADFQDIVVTHETTEPMFDTAVRRIIAEQPLGEYYWRVKTRRANANDVWSEARRVNFALIDALDSTTASAKPQGVYSLLGVYLGQHTTGLAGGLYIVNGNTTLIP